MTAEWQDIASAPKDGTFFIATGPFEGFWLYVIAYYDTEYEPHFRSCCGDSIGHATHWLPLPTPPETNA